MATFKAPLVVGYKGEIGSFILQGLLKTMPKALSILCYDVSESEKEKTERIRKSDVIFLCVPIQNTIEWFWKNALLLEGKTIIEQCSLKSFLYEDFLIKEKDFTLISMHILFRPSATPDIKDRKIGLLNTNLNIWDDILGIADELEEITQSKTVWFENYEEHDKVMATQQALTHRIIRVLSNSINDDLQTTYIGQKILALNRRISSGDPVLYKMIQENKYLPKALEKFNKRLSKFKI